MRARAQKGRLNPENFQKQAPVCLCSVQHLLPIRVPSLSPPTPYFTQPPQSALPRQSPLSCFVCNFANSMFKKLTQFTLYSSENMDCACQPGNNFIDSLTNMKRGYRHDYIRPISCLLCGNVCVSVQFGSSHISSLKPFQSQAINRLYLRSDTNKRRSMNRRRNPVAPFIQAFFCHGS